MSTALFEELRELLQQGTHVALIAPRQSGKALAVFELRRLATHLREADRPKVVVLRSLDFRVSSKSHFVSALSRCLNVPEPDVADSDAMPLAATVLALVRDALRPGRPPLWLFVQNITEFAWPLARALLTAFQEASEDPCTRAGLSVVVTGSQEFVPLTYHENSPYRHATKYFLTGFDRELTRRFFRARVVGYSLEDGFADVPEHETTPVTEDALDLLYRETGGYGRFIEEIVLTANRPGTATESSCRGVPWSSERVRDLTDRFLREHMIFEPFCKLSLRDVERDDQAWDMLQRLVDHSSQDVAITGNQPHLLETSGIARRHECGRVVFSSPMWERFLTDLLGSQRRADVYARQGRWDRAWPLYANSGAADCDRPLDGDDRYMLDGVIGDWADSLVDYAALGSDQVLDFFLQGIRYLFGFHAASLRDRSTGRIMRQFLSEELRERPRACGEPIKIEDPTIDLKVFAARLTIQTAPKDNPLAERIGFEPELELTRGEGREIDTATLRRLCRPLSRFWHAFLIAKRAEYDATLGDLREKHLDVVARVDELLSLYPGDMRKVVEGTVDALIDIAGYYRILICLVSPSGDRIQAVAGRCADPDMGFNYPTDYLLDRSSPQADWDIQQWVAIKGVTAAVPDASSSVQVNPRTNSDPVQRIGMKAIAVVPVKVARWGADTEEILGTIHFERKDKQLPSEAELRSLEILAGQIATAFDHARRITMLEEALNALEAEFRIVSPDKRVVFLNRAAAMGAPTYGWHYPITVSASRTSIPVFERQVINDAAKLGRRGHRYFSAEGDEPHRAWDEFAAPIHDFRAQLDGVFTSDGKLGFAHQVHDLSEFFEMHETLQKWLALANARETARRILAYFQQIHFQWCRIYLYRADAQTRGHFESFEEFGIADAVVQREFRDGKFRIRADDPAQDAWFLIREHKSPFVCRFDSKLKSGPMRDAEFYRGIPTIRVNEPWREEFGKGDTEWIEAPLVVGEELIGLIALWMPPDSSPAWYEKLRWHVTCVAIALNDAIHAEHVIERQKEEAWQSASQLAIHQLSNKLGPVESSCHFVREWLALQGVKVVSGCQKAIDLLASAEHGIEFCRGILNDFRRYAADGPLRDMQVHTLSELIAKIVGDLRRTGPGIRIDVEPTSPDMAVEASASALLEVLEVLRNNSTEHSGKSPEELQILISAKAVEVSEERPGGARQTCCLIYRDNGRGISDDVRGRIFEPFFTTRAKGNGLGLSIAQRILRRQGGRIAEEGSQGAGAKFCIYLPVAESAVTKGGK